MRRLLGCALIFAAGEASAGPLASLKEDVDGDGTPDAIELDDAGVVHVGGKQRADVAVARGATKGTLAVARNGAVASIVVDATTPTGREAIVLDGARGWREAARFPLGGIGLDQEFSTEVDASPQGVIRYQRRAGFERCDGKPSYLFAERLEGTQWKRLDQLPPRVASAALLVAHADTAAAGAPLVYFAKGASHQAGAPDAGALSTPTELDDGKLETGWREDLPNSAGEGQFFTFQPRIPSAAAHQLRIVPGDPRSAAAQKAVGRPRGLFVVTASGAFRTELPDAANEPLGAAFTVELPKPVTGCVTVILESAWGTPRAPTAIAELEVYAEGERAGGGEAILAKLVAEGKDGATSAANALARRGAAAATALDAEIGRTTDAAARRRLVGALVKVKDPAAIASLVHAATEGWVRGADLLELIGALGGQTQALHDLAAKTALPVDARVAAVAKLRVTDGGLDALLDLAGTGPAALRRAVTEQLAAAPLVTLVQRASTASDAAASGDVWRALARHAKAVAADRPAAVAAMSAALAGATDYERRYRLVDGIATYGDAPAIAALEAMLRGLPAGAETSALRQVAIRGVGQAPRVDAIGLVIGLARDADPGVRLTALVALATADADATGPWHQVGGPDGIDRVIINGLAGDMWPEVRRRAAAALGSRCQRIGPAKALVEAVDKDPELDVRGDALAGLVQCRAAGADKLLSRVWHDGKAPLALRQRAVDLVVALEDRALAATLVRDFTRWRGEAITSVDALGLAQHAAATIGMLAPDGAAKALLDALDDSAFPEIVSSAALGLGALGPNCPPAAKTKLNALARSDDQSSIVAKRAAAQCGR